MKCRELSRTTWRSALVFYFFPSNFFPYFLATLQGSESEVAQSRLTLCDSMDRSLHFPGNSTGVDCHFLLQWIFPTQGLPHCRQTLCHLSHQGSPLQGKQDLISLTRDWTCAPCSGSMVSQPLDHWGSPRSTLVERWRGIRRQASGSEHLAIALHYPGSP